MILIVDDEAIVREPIAACLQMAGYETLCAASGREGLALACKHLPRLVLLDLAMPGMTGLQFLQLLRDDPRIADTPVILLTAASNKQTIVEAARLKVTAYLLKSRFSSIALVERVQSTLQSTPRTEANTNLKPAVAPIAAPGAGGPVEVNPGRSPQAPPAGKEERRPGGKGAGRVPSGVGPVTTNRPNPEPTESRAPAGTAEPPRGTETHRPGALPVLLGRDECIARAKEAVRTKTLSGVVTQVISLAASPRGDVGQLATLIGRDPALSARVLGAANTAAYASAGKMVTTISEAVRKIGFSSVRNIAAAAGVFDAMPPTGADGFNPIRCWQHSFAVAQLCETFEQNQSPGVASMAYVVGLCHDLAEIVIRTQFGSELQQVLDMQAQSGLEAGEVERQMLGMTRHQLVLTVLQSIGLPDSIRAPIEAFHKGRFTGNETNRQAAVVWLADQYANGLLLASGPDAPVMAFTQADCREIFSRQVPERPDGEQFRSTILGLTGMLARLSPAEETALMAPLYTPQPARVGLVRESLFTEFDPIFAALQSLCGVRLLDRVPSPAQAGELDGLVLVTRKNPLPQTMAADVATISGTFANRPDALLWLVSQIEPVMSTGGVQPTPFPVTLRTLAEYVGRLGARLSAAA
jgi:CheY-like chemotaxis protein/HD-like signal output (HDOD) protein